MVPLVNGKEIRSRSFKFGLNLLKLSAYFVFVFKSRVCVQVSLPPHTALQIDCLAHKNTATPHHDGDMMVTPPVRNTMYVQSISHWAPANLGPYSQAVQVGLKMHQPHY